jgi:benzodiazapine receptor
MDALPALAVFLAMVFAAASTGGIFRPDEWYRALAKPGWTPKDWVFPVVWSLLYLAIAVASWLIWREAGWSGIAAYAALTLNLLLNAGWSWVFFGLKRIRLALWEAGALWLSTALLLSVYAAHSPVAAGLIAPYLVWVTVAFALNLSILRRNPAAAR